MPKVPALIASLCLITLPITGFSAEEPKILNAQAGSGGIGATSSPASRPGESRPGSAQGQLEPGASPRTGDLAADTAGDRPRKARRTRLETIRAMNLVAAAAPDRLDSSASQASPASPFRLERDFAGPSLTSSYPEADIAAGPDHVVQAVRRVVRVTDKHGSTLLEESFSTWWSPVVIDYVANGASVLYDTDAARWILGVTGWSTTTFDSWHLLSVSKTADPTGDWCVFALPAWIDGNTPTNTFADSFLRADVDSSGVYIASNQFDNDTGEFVYSKLRVIDRTSLYDPTCGPISWHDFTGLTTVDEDSVMPARTVENPDREYFVGTPSLGGSEIRLWSVQWSGGEPVLMAEATLPVAPFAVPPEAQQPHDEVPLTIVDARLLAAVFHDGVIYATNTVACGSGDSCVRFFGVDVATKSVVLDETYGAPGSSYMAAGLGVSGGGDLVAVMNRSGAQEFVGSRFAVRTKGAGSFGPSIALKSGETIRSLVDGWGRNPWGLQNAATSDPSDPRRFWLIAAHAGRTPGEYGTWIGAVVPSAHTLTINSGPSISMNPVFPGFPVDLSVTAVDTSGHALTWTWSASCAGLASGGTLDDPASPNPAWTPPANPGYSARSCSLSVTVEDGGSSAATASMKVGLLPDPDRFELLSDFSTSANWFAYPPWSLSGESVHSAPYAFSDSPSSEYAADVVAYLYSPYFGLSTGFVYLSWWQTYDLERDGDLASLWIAGGVRITRKLRSFSGTRSGWHQAFMDLSPDSAKGSGYLIYQLYSNVTGSRDGWHIDDVAVKALSFTPHTIVFTAGPCGNANPSKPGGDVDLSVQATDFFDWYGSHKVYFTWSSDCPQLGSGGTFSDPAIAKPVWMSPPNTTGTPAECSISVVASDHGSQSASASFVQTVLPDADADGVEDGLDVCASVHDPGQADDDGDGVGDACDVCPATVDPVQADLDADGRGDACDNCPAAQNPAQEDADGDSAGDACDVCPAAVDPAQADLDADGRGDACDNCPAAQNPAQEDADGDSAGDACDVCPAAVDPAQADLDADGRGDACDNCPAAQNPAQSDLDADGAGDACDLTVVSPLDGASLSCGDGPPAVVWTAGRFDQFRVDVSTEPEFRPNHRFTSGKKLIGAGTTTWTPPAKKWSRTCRRAGSGSLYVRVYGRVRGSKDTGYSQVVALDVP